VTEITNAALMFASMQKQYVKSGEITCYICKQGARAGDPWEAEHREARNGSRRGAHDESNVCHAHQSCNRLKGAHNL
jgi:hypothetical protein